jgi:hypothetical protein
MIGVTSALIGLAVYFLTLFVFGMLWRRREVAQKLREAVASADQTFSSQPTQTGDYVHLR